ncbi:MAG: aminotransferase class III-fold pyridoxal phosphate-dependent enzyme, partial [Chloroflexaceae bacterium]|nr:aminotransferase class III-fold pyridoxal phosphate-dependent enzyme [Chloroflexaceae bacterium]
KVAGFTRASRWGALATTLGSQRYREPFEPLIAGVSHVAYNKLDELDAAVTAETAAVLIELVQGEGGVRPADADYVQGVARICRERGALLMVDEVQTGFGRTGRLWASQHYGITPDLMPISKSIAGGLPMGAIGIHGRHGTLPPATHGTTFGGNPLTCAAARATLRVLQAEDLPRQAAEKGAYLVERLQALNLARVREIRSLGLLIGLELKERVQPFLVQLMEAHAVLALPAGPTVLRLLPPLVIEYEQLDRVIAAVAAVLSSGD